MSPLPELIDYYCQIVHSFFQVVTDFFIEVFFYYYTMSDTDVA